MAKPRPPPRELKFENIQHDHLRLRTKPTAKLAYSFIPAHDHPSSIAAPGHFGGEPLLVFLSGLDNPKFVWQKTLERLFEAACAIGDELPPMLFYDRYGCGRSDADPADEGKRVEEYHDCADATRDLHQLLVQIMETKFGWDRVVDADAPQHLPRIVFCAHSFGVSMARMFATAYPGVVQGILMIDSAIAAYRAEDLIVNPDDPVSWASATDPTTVWGKIPDLGLDIVTKDELRDAIRQTRKSHISGYPTTTRERMRWDHMPQQLPRSDEPKLRGPTEHLPLVTVLVADMTVSGPQIAKVCNIPRSILQ
jgi:pimeloyl-ACP methyl ester carboxylesterase